jgi:hypothetical protein
MYAMNIQNDVISLVLCEHCKSKQRADVTTRYMILTILKSQINVTRILSRIRVTFICDFSIVNIMYRVVTSARCFDLQCSHSTRPMTSFCIFIAYINTEGILFNVKITIHDIDYTKVTNKRYTDSDCPFGIFKLFLHVNFT